MPKVSVIIPNYNHARFLDQRILSVLGQTYRDMEVLILDDASTDNSISIIDKYRGDPRVRIVVNKTNSGSPFPQWNLGVKLACGEYIWIAESDDDAEPELLETLVHQLDNHPSVVLAYCQSWVMDGHGGRLNTPLSWNDNLDSKRWKSSFQNDGSDEVRRYLIFQNTIPNASAVVFRRSVFLEVGGAPTNMRLCGDWMTWVLIALKGDIALISTPLNLFRTHPGTVRSSIPRVVQLEEWSRIVKTIKDNLFIPFDVRRKLAIGLLDQWRTLFRTYPHPVAFSTAFNCGLLMRWADPIVAVKFLWFFLLYSVRRSIYLCRAIFGDR